MLNKLIKYDFKWIYKTIIIFNFLALLFAILGRCFVSIDSSILMQIIGKICFGITISMGVSGLINALMRSWVRFIRNTYKDESYLTHTLPVSKSKIYSSKIISGIISVMLNFLVLIICLFICYYSKDTINYLKDLLELTANTYNTSVVNLLLMVFLVILFELIFILLVGYTGIIIGNKRNNHKMIHSVFTSIGLYLVSSAISLEILHIISFFSDDVKSLFMQVNTFEVGVLKTAMIYAIIIYFVYIIIYYLLSNYLFNKGVNVD